MDIKQVEQIKNQINTYTAELNNKTVELGIKNQEIETLKSSLFTEYGVNTVEELITILNNLNQEVLSNYNELNTLISSVGGTNGQ